MRHLYWGIALIGFGILILLDNMGYADMGEVISTFWPLLLVLVGANILLRRSAEERAERAAQASSADALDASEVLGDVDLKTVSQAFRGGSVSTFLGDTRIDLSGVRIAEGSHELRIHAVFGNSMLILPAGGAYSVTASTTIGSLAIPGERKGGFSPRVHVASPAFAAASGRLTVVISHMFGDTRVEESAAPKAA